MKGETQTWAVRGVSAQLIIRVKEEVAKRGLTLGVAVEQAFNLWLGVEPPKTDLQCVEQDVKRLGERLLVVERFVEHAVEHEEQSVDPGVERVEQIVDHDVEPNVERKKPDAAMQDLIRSWDGEKISRREQAEKLNALGYVTAMERDWSVNTLNKYASRAGIKRR